MGKAVGGLQSQVARWLTGRLPRRTPDGKWTYTLAAKELDEEGFLKMEEYIRLCHNTVALYIATQSLLDLCEE